MPIQHSRQEATDTAARRKLDPRHAWHPIPAAVEQEPDTWHMVDPTGKQYAIVRMLRRGGELGYRAATWAERSEDRQLIGYYQNLRAATMAAHMQFIRAHGVNGAANGH